MNKTIINQEFQSIEEAKQYLKEITPLVEKLGGKLTYLSPLVGGKDKPMTKEEFEKEHGKGTKMTRKEFKALLDLFEL